MATGMAPVFLVITVKLLAAPMMAKSIVAVGKSGCNYVGDMVVTTVTTVIAIK
jgi:competence protein ComGC